VHGDIGVRVIYRSTDFYIVIKMKVGVRVIFDGILYLKVYGIVHYTHQSRWPRTWKWKTVKSPEISHCSEKRKSQGNCRLLVLCYCSCDSHQCIFPRYSAIIVTKYGKVETAR